MCECHSTGYTECHSTECTECHSTECHSTECTKCHSTECTEFLIPEFAFEDNLEFFLMFGTQHAVTTVLVFEENLSNYKQWKGIYWHFSEHLQYTWGFEPFSRSFWFIWKFNFASKYSPLKIIFMVWMAFKWDEWNNFNFMKYIQNVTGTPKMDQKIFKIYLFIYCYI